MLYEVKGTHFGETKTIKTFDLYQDALEFCIYLEWYFIDENGIDWELSL